MLKFSQMLNRRGSTPILLAVGFLAVLAVAALALQFFAGTQVRQSVRMLAKMRNFSGAELSANQTLNLCQSDPQNCAGPTTRLLASYEQGLDCSGAPVFDGTNYVDGTPLDLCQTLQLFRKYGGGSGYYRLFQSVQSLSPIINGGVIKYCGVMRGPKGETRVCIVRPDNLVVIAVLRSDGTALNYTYDMVQKKFTQFTPIPGARDPRARDAALTTPTQSSVKFYSFNASPNRKFEAVGRDQAGVDIVLQNGFFRNRSTGNIINVNKPDRKIISFGIVGNLFYVLRSDGQIFRTPDLADPSTFTEWEGARDPKLIGILSTLGPDDIS